MPRVFNIDKNNNNTFFNERRLSVVYLRECLPFCDVLFACLFSPCLSKINSNGIFCFGNPYTKKKKRLNTRNVVFFAN